jgi:hypothetical protein
LKQQNWFEANGWTFRVTINILLFSSFFGLLGSLHLVELLQLLELEEIHWVAAGQNATYGEVVGVGLGETGIGGANGRNEGLVLHVLADLLRNDADVFHEFDDLELHGLEDLSEIWVVEDD